MHTPHPRCDIRSGSATITAIPTGPHAPVRHSAVLPLTPTDDRAPVELAVVDGIAADHEPDTFLWIVFHRPDGGATIRYAWTGNGTLLGDRIDQLAVAKGLDAADWLHIGDRNNTRTIRGRIVIDAFRLHGVLADVRDGARCLEDRRDGLRRIIAYAAEITGHTPRPGVPRWLGVGPSLLARRTP